MDVRTRFDEIRRCKTGAQKVRLLAYGSSNTERRIPGTHWFDCLDLAIKNRFGRIHHCVNSGAGGETSSDLLARFEKDAAFYKPDLAFITIGGNDSSPVVGVSEKLFEANLFELHSKFSEIGCFVVFQTYYAPIVEGIGKSKYSVFCGYMDIVREVAAATNAGLIDHFAYWLPLRRREPERYLKLMLDAFHVNPLGNLVLGKFVARKFACDLSDPYFDEAEEYMRLMDSLASEEGACI